VQEENSSCRYRSRSLCDETKLVLEPHPKESDPKMNRTKTVCIEPVYTDVRGSIFDLIEDTVAHVGIVTFKAGAVRANHYHKVSTQYSYVISGELELFTSCIDGSDKKTERLGPGSLSTIPPGIIHKYIAITDAMVLDVTTLSRLNNQYETDTIRVTNE
jgi:quercetin dioxygenase-like cupin family protein